MHPARRGLVRLSRLGSHLCPVGALFTGPAQAVPRASCSPLRHRDVHSKGAAISRHMVSNDNSLPLVKTEVVHDVAIVTMLAPDGQFDWGTRYLEHRLNPFFIQNVNKALDVSEEVGAQAIVFIGEGKFFSNGMDLQYIHANIEQATDIQIDAEKLLSRLLTFQVPTIAALNGHFAAAGAMLGLAFDVRVMPSDGNGLFFVPGIDIGLVYSAGMTELMKAKLPQPMWTDIISFGKRYRCEDLLKAGVVNEAPPAKNLLPRALEIATSLKAKGKSPRHRDTLHGIKKNLYKDAVTELGRTVEDMGFADGICGARSRAAQA